MAARKRERPQTTVEFAERFRRFRLPTPWFHRAWYAAYDDPKVDRVYIQGPREHAKTSTVLTYVVRRLVEDPRIRVGIVSGSDPLAMKFLNEVKHELEANEDLIRVYGGPFVGPKWTEHELVTAQARKVGLPGKDVSLFAVGRGGQVSSRHCDVLIVDDVESADAVKSPTVRQNTREWWSREVIPVLSPGGKLIVTGTRKHFDDLYSYLIRDPRWAVIDLAKAVYDEAGNPIWPEMWSAESLMARRAELDAQDILAWPQEYLNAPRPSESQMFWPDDWPTYTKLPHGLTILQFWDLAISERTSADFTVGWTIGVNDANDVYIIERRRGHWNFNQTLAEIEAMGNAYPDVNLIGIEQVAYQAAAVQEALRRTMLPIVPVVPDKDKVTRARLLEARAVAKKVYRPEDVRWWSDFAQEAAFFPAGAHDDQIDALAGAIRLAGDGSNLVAWAMGVWECPGCKHMFSWAANRPCPKCGQPAAEVYENPELVAYGGSMAANQNLTEEQRRILYTMQEKMGITWVRDAAEWVYWKADAQAVLAWCKGQHRESEHDRLREEIQRLDRLFGSAVLR